MKPNEKMCEECVFKTIGGVVGWLCFRFANRCKDVEACPGPTKEGERITMYGDDDGTGKVYKEPIRIFREDEFLEFMMAMKAKFMSRAGVKGNTMMPWRDFTKDHLTERLEEEWKEWECAHEQDELIDLANFSLFIWTAMEEERNVYIHAKDEETGGMD